MQKSKKFQSDPEENASKAYRQTDRQTRKTNFIGLLPQSWRFNHIFRKFKNKIWK